MLEKHQYLILFYYQQVLTKQMFGRKKNIHLKYFKSPILTPKFLIIYGKLKPWYTYRPYNQIKYRFTNFYFMLKLQPGQFCFRYQSEKSPALKPCNDSYYPPVTSKTLNMTQPSHVISFFSLKLSNNILPLALFFCFLQFLQDTIFLSFQRAFIQSVLQNLKCSHPFAPANYSSSFQAEIKCYYARKAFPDLPNMYFDRILDFIALTSLVITCTTPVFSAKW